MASYISFPSLRALLWTITAASVWIAQIVLCVQKSRVTEAALWTTAVFALALYLATESRRSASGLLAWSEKSIWCALLVCFLCVGLFEFVDGSYNNEIENTSRVFLLCFAVGTTKSRAHPAVSGEGL